MPLIPPTPALRSFRNRSHDVAKIALVIPAGHELVVTEAVAAQLDAREFLDLAAKPSPAPTAAAPDVEPAPDPEKPGAKSTPKKRV